MYSMSGCRQMQLWGCIRILRNFSMRCNTIHNKVMPHTCSWMSSMIAQINSYHLAASGAAHGQVQKHYTLQTGQKTAQCTNSTLLSYDQATALLFCTAFSTFFFFLTVKPLLNQLLAFQICHLPAAKYQMFIAWTLAQLACMHMHTCRSAQRKNETSIHVQSQMHL